MKSITQKFGRYNVGGTSTTSGNMLTYWDRTTFPQDPSDVTITIQPQYAYRPSRLAYDLYGFDSLMWFILQYNSIVDINEQFGTGATIQVPTKSRLFSSLLVKPSL